MQTIYPPAHPDSLPYKALCKNLGGEVAFSLPDDHVFTNMVPGELKAALARTTTGAGRSMWCVLLDSDNAVEVKPVRILRKPKGDAGDHFNACFTPEAGPWDTCICDTGEDVYAFTAERRNPAVGEAYFDPEEPESGVIVCQETSNHRPGLCKPEDHIILKEARWP